MVVRQELELQIIQKLIMYGNMISNFTYSGIQVEDGSVATIGGNKDSDGILEVTQLPDQLRKVFIFQAIVRLN